MFSIASVKAKVIIGLVIFAVISALGGFMWHQSNKIEGLQKDKTELTLQVKSKDAAIEETARREVVVDAVNTEANKERIIIEKHYQTKVDKINESVKEGKDRPVGPLLNEYFNGGL